MTPILDLVQLSAIITATVGVVTGAYKTARGRELSEVAKKTVTGTICAGAAIGLSYQSGTLGFDWHDAGAVMGQFGVLLTVSSQLYDKVLHPVKAATKTLGTGKVPTDPGLDAPSI